ncbi:MAG: hypothetical protein JWO19_2696 [Bryobacterales bacterium]|nr:hypothetical protein [Bryobacterales bacterium]
MPLIAAGLAELRHGRFSFYPAIVGVRHNEWILRRATWTDILVANAKTSEELCIPRRFVGEVSSIEAPFRIVGLVKELEYREGVALPHRRSVIEMPLAVNDFNRSSLRPALYGRPAGVVAIRAEPDSESRFWRVLRGSVAAGILACVSVMFVVRDAHLGTRFGWTSATARLPNFNQQDDYSSVVRKLGNPTGDRWFQSAFGSRGYRRLWYSRRGVTLILMGASPDNARYAGTLNRDGEIIHSVDADLINELDSAPVLR